MVLKGLNRNKCHWEEQYLRTQILDNGIERVKYNKLALQQNKPTQRKKKNQL
jgi:hypothetical protein